VKNITSASWLSYRLGLAKLHFSDLSDFNTRMLSRGSLYRNVVFILLLWYEKKKKNVMYSLAEKDAVNLTDMTVFM